MKVGTGDDAILLCTSLSANNIKVNGEVDDCCIVIHDVIGFASAITNALIREGHHVRMVLKGPCVYSDRKIERPMPSGKISDFIEKTQGKDSFDFGKMFGFASEISKYDIYFCKPIENRFENEYRILWLLDDDVTQERYDIVVPDARQFCSKIKF